MLFCKELGFFCICFIGLKEVILNGDFVILLRCNLVFFYLSFKLVLYNDIID